MSDTLGNLMKQAQAMQESFKKAQAEMVNVRAKGESGGGMVKVTLNGQYEAVKVELDPSLLNDDKELLEDLVAAAITDAARRVAQVVNEKIQEATGGLQLPPGFKMPF